MAPNYMDNQKDLNERMRGILIDWLIEVDSSRPNSIFNFIGIVVVFSMLVMIGLL